MKQEVVHKGGKNFLRIHGDCEGGTVKVRLRSRSRENLKPKPPWSVPVITLHNNYIHCTISFFNCKMLFYFL